MKSSYFDLIDQGYKFPQEGFALQDGYLTFYGVSLKYLIDKYGTPFKLFYLPRIGEQIRRANQLFNAAINKTGYKGSYHYCYCTKCCHFSHVVKAALREGVHLETSSSFDIDVIYRLYNESELSLATIIVHNGYKTDEYLKKIIKLHKSGFRNSILVLDSKSEIERVKKYSKNIVGQLKIGIRIAIDEEPQSAYYTSRLGIRPGDIPDLYREQIATDNKLCLKMLHFFIDSGIKDTFYYWGEFQKALGLYVELSRMCPDLKAINLGGGFPIRNNLGFSYDYENIVNLIVSKIQQACKEEDVPDPDLFTEFGKYTVGESAAIIFSVIEQKLQNSRELWYMIDNSLMNTIPDAWSINEKFIMLPVNKWQNDYVKVNIGGISCDHLDYYNSEDFNQQLFLPSYKSGDDEPLYIGFFHTGAYQDSISGYGGIKHCLIPAPKVITIDRDDKGNFVDQVYRNEQTVNEMLSILGYNTEDKF